MKVAIVHYWFVAMRGGEKVVEALLELYPQADLYAHVVDPAALSPALKSRTIRTTFIARMPGARKHYQKYLPLMPFALEDLDLTGYDLVISSESGPAKGIVTSPDALHVCYCHSPMRYLWDHYPLYRERAGRFTRFVMRAVFPFLRVWDTASAARIDCIVANSRFVARRILKAWGREAEVVFPPVDLGAFAPSDTVDDYYLCAGQLVAYKRTELAIEAFNRLGKRLVIVGTGEDEPRLRALAGPTITFAGRQDDAAFARLYARCRALVFPGQEDFGMVPVEAMASGRPVLAYDSGGARDTVVDGVTGLLFPEQTVDCLVATVQRFETCEATFDSGRIRAHAERFGRARFMREFGDLVRRHLNTRAQQADTPRTDIRPLAAAGRPQC